MASPINRFRTVTEEDLALLDQMSTERLCAHLIKSKKQESEKQAQTILPAAANSVPWNDYGDVNPNNLIAGSVKTDCANSSYWYLIPTAVVAIVVVCHQAKLIARMGSYLTNSIKSGLTLLTSKSPARIESSVIDEYRCALDIR